jgi:two-component system osmolarity sensor histidine kinase EnvZ
MDELIGDSLRFARGTFETPVLVEVGPLLREVVASIDDQCPIEWVGRDDVTRMVAPGALRRVLQNLIANARTHAGCVARVKVEVDDRAVRIHVIDLGPGIPAASREAVLQPFYRLEKSRSQATGGSGLGLAIVQQLCQTHGWTIEIADVEPTGTDVTVTIAA